MFCILAYRGRMIYTNALAQYSHCPHLRLISSWPLILTISLAQALMSATYFSGLSVSWSWAADANGRFRLSLQARRIKDCCNDSKIAISNCYLPYCEHFAPEGWDCAWTVQAGPSALPGNVELPKATGIPGFACCTTCWGTVGHMMTRLGCFNDQMFCVVP